MLVMSKTKTFTISQSVCRCLLMHLFKIGFASFVERENSSVVSILSLGGERRLSTELQVLEEEEKVREEVQEIEKESQSEEKRSDDHDHVDGVKDSLLEPRCVCR